MRQGDFLKKVPLTPQKLPKRKISNKIQHSIGFKNNKILKRFGGYRSLSLKGSCKKIMKFLVDGRPTLTVMVQGRTPERVIELIERGHEGGGDAFGVQLEPLENQYHNKETYKRFYEAAKGKPIYVTSYRYGAGTGKSDRELADEILEFTAMGKEYNTLVLTDVMGDIFCKTPYELTMDEKAIEEQKKYIAELHALGAEVLMSSHVLEFREGDDVLKIAEAHKERGVDISKIVTKADTKEELLKNFETSARLTRELGIPSLFLCGGDECTLHRRAAQLIMNTLYLCIVEIDECCTAAQPLLRIAKALVDTASEK